MKLDVGRLSVFSRAEQRQIASDANKAIAEQLDALDRALRADDFTSASEAAHRARNETLLVGASGLSEAFAALEQAARARRGADARAAAAQARTLWPAARAAITALAHPEQGATG